MTTLQNLIDDCEADLGDPTNATWSAANIEQWCRDAIADYGMHFPKLAYGLLDSAEDVREYTVEDDVTEVISVEYPAGQEPPHMLQRRSRYDDDFFYSDDYYDVSYYDTATTSARLFLSALPSSVVANTIKVTYLAMHANNMVTTGAISIPPVHEHILRNYVAWRAALQLKAVEEATPTSGSSLLMSQYAVNADRARRAYADSLAKALYAWSRSGPVSWSGRADETTRIY